MYVEVITSKGLGVEHIERHHDVRSLSIPSSRGMVRLDDVTELLRDHEDVPEHAVRQLCADIDEDPDTGGHITINSDGKSAHTAAFESVDIFREDVHEARDGALVGPDEAWLRRIVPRDLLGAVDESRHAPDEAAKSETLVVRALRKYLTEEIDFVEVSDP